MFKTHIWLNEPTEKDGCLRVSAVIERPNHEKQTLWYDIPEEHSALVTPSGDAFVIGNIFLIMAGGVECVLHGNLSPSLLRNLSEFQAAWSCWRPGKYKQVSISAETEVEDLAAEPPAVAIAAFSGGVDSAYTIFRHTLGSCPEHWKRNIQAGLFVKGFDIPLEHGDAFDRAKQKIESTLDDVGIKLITMSTNLHDLNIEWDDTHIAGLASTLMLFKGKYNEGLIASGPAYSRLVLPWGSNPVTDHLLSSKNFQIVHDSTSVPRVEKIKELPVWKMGYSNLRICFSAERRDENCGKCAKCIMDILLMRLENIPQPASYPELTNDDLSKLTIPTEHQFHSLSSVVTYAREHKIAGDWIEILDHRIQHLVREKKNMSAPKSKIQKLLSLFDRFSGNS